MAFWNKVGFYPFLGIVFGSFFLLVLIVVVFGVIFYCMYRRYRRRSRYSRIRGRDTHDLSTSVNLQQVQNNQGVFEAMHHQATLEEQRRKEVALLSCQFYLRSLPEYELDHQLPDIGSRMSKNWFVVHRTGVQALMTMLPISQHCRLNLQEEKYTLRRLIGALNHMNIHQLLAIDYIPDRRLVVILEPLHTRGSLKDHIYQTTPELSWSTKYSVRRSGLKLKQIQKIGSQVLHGILFLHQLGFKPLGQVQSGNIFLDGGTVKLSGYENYLLGYKPRIYRLVKDFEKDVDSAMFGHLLFELSSGRELTTTEPFERDLEAMKYGQIKEVLKFIFQSETREIPTIEEILKHPFFCSQEHSGLDHWSYEGVKLDESMKSIIVKSRAGKLNKQLSTDKARGGKQRKRNLGSRYPVFKGHKPSSLTPIPQSPNTTLLPEETKEPHVDNNNKKSLESVAETGPVPSPSARRSALLGDIRSGTSLRKTVTNDRSAPVLK